VTTPWDEEPRTDPPAGPSVNTAPPRARWRFGTVPSHVGPARLSTVVLSVLFVGIFVLYLFVRPDPASTGTNGGGSTVPAAPAATTSRAPTSSAPAATTTSAPTSTPGQSSSGQGSSGQGSSGESTPGQGSPGQTGVSSGPAPGTSGGSTASAPGAGSAPATPSAGSRSTGAPTS
jgi:hypothetical protein